MPRRTIYVLWTALLVSALCHVRTPRPPYPQYLADVIAQVEDRALEPVEGRVLYEAALAGMLSQLDENSGYVGVDRAQRFDEEFEQEFAGVGIVVGVSMQTGRLTVISPKPDSPAAQAGVRAGDVILRINDADTAGMSLDDALGLMRGRVGEPVALRLQGVGDEPPRQVTVVRAPISVESVLGDRRRPDGEWDFRWELDPSIAWIRIESFGVMTAAEVRAALEQAPDARALLLDLRGNTGGLLTAAVAVCDLFIDDGAIVTLRGRGGVIQEEHVATPGDAFSERPIVVLVDGASASASEIVAGCLQDHDRAIVCGERSYGKGTVQNIVPIERGKARLRLTTSEYWRPSGQKIHRTKESSPEDAWGVTPDDDCAVLIDDETRRRWFDVRRSRDYPADPNNAAPSDAGSLLAADPALRQALEVLAAQLPPGESG